MFFFVVDCGLHPLISLLPTRACRRGSATPSAELQRIKDEVERERELQDARERDLFDTIKQVRATERGAGVRLVRPCAGLEPSELSRPCPVRCFLFPSRLRTWAVRGDPSGGAQQEAGAEAGGGGAP